MPRIAHHHTPYVLDGFDQVDAAAERRVELTDGPLDLGVSRVTDEKYLACFAGITRDLHVHLGHQRTGGVEHREGPALCLLLHHPRHSVRAEDHSGAGGHLLEFLDKHGTDGAQAVHHVFVVHDLMAHVDGRPEQVDGALDDIDGSIDAGAESTRIGEKYLHQCFRLDSNSASSRSSAAPTVIAESATLNAGKYARFQ